MFYILNPPFFRVKSISLSFNFLSTHTITNAICYHKSMQTIGIQTQLYHLDMRALYLMTNQIRQTMHRLTLENIIYKMESVSYNSVCKGIIISCLLLLLKFLFYICHNHGKTPFFLEKTLFIYSNGVVTFHSPVQYSILKIFVSFWPLSLHSISCKTSSQSETIPSPQLPLMKVTIKQEHHRCISSK